METAQAINTLRGTIFKDAHTVNDANEHCLRRMIEVNFSTTSRFLRECAYNAHKDRNWRDRMYDLLEDNQHNPEYTMYFVVWYLTSLFGDIKELDQDYWHSWIEYIMPDPQTLMAVCELVVAEMPRTMIGLETSVYGYE